MEHAGPSSAGFTSPDSPAPRDERRPRPRLRWRRLPARRAASRPDRQSLAPDCSACGVRLDYMRYVCAVRRGRAVDRERGRQDAVRAAKAAKRTERRGRDRVFGGHSVGPAASSTGSQTVYRGDDGRSRSGSLSTNASVHSLAVANGSAVSPGSPRSIQFDLDGNPQPARHRSTPRGYGLCPPVSSARHRALQGC
jgi:hypothetical protein